MYQLLISLLLALGIIVSAEQFNQMSLEQKRTLETEHIVIEEGSL